MLHHAHNKDNKDTIQLVIVHWSTYSWHRLSDCQMIYLATKFPKQSISDKTTRSCAGTPSTAFSTSHHSKFRTSWTQNTRSSVSTVQRPQVIERFLWTTAARSWCPWATMWQMAALDLLRDSSFLAKTGKVVTPPTRFTTTLSYRVVVRMEGHMWKSLGRNAMLACTHGKRDEAWDGWCLDQDRSHVLQRWKVCQFKIFIHLSQERLNTSLKQHCLETSIVLWIGSLRHRRTWQTRRRESVTPSTWQGCVQCCASHWHVIDRHDPTNFALWFKSFVQSMHAPRVWKNGIQQVMSPKCPWCACHNLASLPCHMVVNDCGVFWMGHMQLPRMVFLVSLDCSKSIKSTCQVTVIRWQVTCWLGFSHWLSNTGCVWGGVQRCYFHLILKTILLFIILFLQIYHYLFPLGIVWLQQ